MTIFTTSVVSALELSTGGFPDALIAACRQFFAWSYSPPSMRSFSSTCVLNSAPSASTSPQRVLRAHTRLPRRMVVSGRSRAMGGRRPNPRTLQQPRRRGISARDRQPVAGARGAADLYQLVGEAGGNLVCAFGVGRWAQVGRYGRVPRARV